MGTAYQPLHPHNQKPATKNPGCFLSKAVCAWLACGFLSLALLHLLCCSPAGTQQAVFSPLHQYINNTYSFVSSVPVEGRSCNYSVGDWVWAPGYGRRYNATECNAKESHDCIRNGRPDTRYLDWRWQPAAGCPLPAFDAGAFLTAVHGKHVAFIGDSMARNQAQSLICLLSTSFPYRLLYRDEGQLGKYKFWRYAFPAHDVKVSYYWNPFLVKATGKSEDETIRDNHVHLDKPGDRWAADADTFDVVVLGAAHWLLNGAIYYNGSEVIGAHNAPAELNYTGVGYAWPLKMAYRTSVERLRSSARPRTLVLATFSMSHFEGKATDDPTSCTKTEPYKDGEKDNEWVYREVRDIVYDEAEAARARSGENSTVRIEVLDVSKLASLRPDGHPGLYMRPNPFANGVPERMYSDCLHFCLPGPVDTFNEILLQILRKKR
ncbi:Protein ALTERED XYLOGLUCAN 4 [Dichanthelium oligosanthes]|uniref:Protein ALTERED XYLOGLUCAN 4 n=1 Tax=Dichanthelium oligosanthes TaxID=888268 RepID=A0A1E5UKJ4_9POAL|nr:Protein ALTERED XYLOGLUCAN 4 [Dichanthelium oligosanthes]